MPMVELKDMLGSGQRAERVGATILQADSCWQPVVDEFFSGVGDEDLPTAGKFQEAGGAVQRWSEIVAAAALRCSRVDGHAYAELIDGSLRLGLERALAIDGSLQRCDRGMEHGRNSIPGFGEDVTAVLFDGFFDDLVVALEGEPHLSQVLFPLGGAAFRCL